MPRKCHKFDIYTLLNSYSVCYCPCFVADGSEEGLRSMSNAALLVDVRTRS